ncbi:unnamed protein product [Spirodela intermedia]|uniref:J domain-containing protein n=1 Tax=Spirodela intermedia TaxID=51605 RepID=A0A7I8IDR0_SPIIN|nr:unnamed protein product [Spirodela intermedia]CAA6655751.1 unnamed protein product [Spirodela intermedia]
MPALGFSANSVPRLAPSTAYAKPWRSGTEQRPRFFPNERRLSSSASFECRAAFSTSSSSVGDYDLYDLLGLESSSDQSQIKSAYRALQKQCHPDIAGPAGHDMAIILNEAYAVLSDPHSRFAYDKVDFRGFTGKPLYSTWFGPESEQRAVFVDEVRCVGCLKCALCARSTFAIETVYGRARVVGQWADPESKILEAIDICPVDCISIVARSDLAALEYLMSKQPRGAARMTGGDNIFSDVKKFQRRYSEMKDRASTEDFKESVLQREARAAAMRGIRSVSYWWYRRSSSSAGSPEARRKLVAFTGTRVGASNNKRLQEAAAKRRAGGTTQPAGRTLPAHRTGEEYWTPVIHSSPRRTTGGQPTGGLRLNPVMMRIPLLVAGIAAATVGVEGGERTSAGIQQHFAGAAALEIVNSSWLQILLAGITWYLLAAAAVGLIAVVQSKED